MTDADDFYVGWADRAPATIARRQRRIALVVVVLAALASLAMISSQPPFAVAAFEFGLERTFEGVLAEAPVPGLYVRRPGRTADAGAHEGWSFYVLVSPFKWGAADAVAGLDGHPARVRGSLIHRDGRTMIELAEPGRAAIEPHASRAPPPPLPYDQGEHTLRGEIVDSKCFLGVMNPGHLKPHRACAVRCLSGGIPPVLLVRDSECSVAYLLLVAEDGSAVNEEILDMVAEPVEITGRVERHAGGLLVLRADPSGYRRIGTEPARAELVR